jgi:hypothetical protein
MKLSENPVFHDRSKHIEIEDYYIMDMIQRGALRLQFMTTEDQVVDVSTKSLSRMKFEYRTSLVWSLFRGSDRWNSSSM